jgi:hypothetical protein
MPATNNSAPSYIHTGHKNRFMCGVLFLTYRSLIGETSKKPARGRAKASGINLLPREERAAARVAEAKAKARLRRGNLVIPPPSSGLYGESPWEQQMKVTNDGRPSSNHRPRP